MKNKSHRIILKDWGKAVFLALILSIITKAFVLQVYTLSSNNMSKTLLKDDRIIVNKFSYGIRLPITLFSFPFFPELYWSKVTLPYHRILKKKSPQHNQVIAINNPLEKKSPIDKRKIFISRCIGLPGDTIQIKKQKIFINSNSLPSTEFSVYKYRIFENIASKNKLGFHDTLLSHSELNTLKVSETTRFISKLTLAQGENNEDYFPNDTCIRWNADYFGPLIIPQKGQRLHITSDNYCLYKDIILHHEPANNFSFENDADSTYTFKYNYYFVINDNWDNTNDSRKWGLVPESHIIGEAFLKFNLSHKLKPELINSLN